jgi:nicotinate dehydrogenase subunit B
MNQHISRRSLLASTGALTVSMALPDVVLAAAGKAGLEKRPALKPDQLASFVTIKADGSAMAWFGKIDGGQGTDIGVVQIVAEELDLPAAKVDIVMGDTGLTVNQGGASGSTGVQEGGAALRNAAAEARRVLVEMGAQKLGVPVDQLVVENGTISVKDQPKKKTTYGELIGGRHFDIQLEWNGKIGNPLAVKGKGHVKAVSAYKVVGTSVPRRDVEPKVMGTKPYVGDVKLPGMLHARSIFPPVAGAVPVAVDESSIKSIPGARVVQIKNYVAVVAPREWDAIKASRALKITWSDVKPPFPSQNTLHQHIREAKPLKREVEVNKGDVDAALTSAAKVVEASYEWPFQSHASMAPACAVVDVKANGEVTLWTSSQKPHYAAEGVANILGVPVDKVHGVWMWGPGSYGRNDAGDVAAEAALLSKAVGKPVRLQWMRNQGHGWDPKGPASVHTVRAGIDAEGKITAWHYESKGFSRLDVNSNESEPSQNLVGQMIDVPLKPTQAFAVPEESYNFANKRKGWTTVAPLLDRSSPLRSSHLRDPLGPQVHFASEAFMDELAMAANMDPVDFRIKNLSEPRDVAVIKAAAEKAGWQPRTSARKQVKGDVAIGQGIAYAQRNGTRVAVIAEVEVNTKTGKVWARKYTVAHDAGLIINPNLLKMTIEGNVVQGTSRALKEEVTFDAHNVTSIDWLTYPILDITEAPETIDVVLINRPEIAPTGAGEASMRPLAAAVANAIYDATGVRMRQAPFTPARIKTGLA